MHTFDEYEGGVLLIERNFACNICEFYEVYWTKLMTFPPPPP